MRWNQRPWQPKLLISKAILSGRLQWWSGPCARMPTHKCLWLLLQQLPKADRLICTEHRETGSVSRSISPNRWPHTLETQADINFINNYQQIFPNLALCTGRSAIPEKKKKEREAERERRVLALDTEMSGSDRRLGALLRISGFMVAERGHNTSKLRQQEQMPKTHASI